MSNMKKITELYKDESFRNEFLNNYEAAGESRQQAEMCDNVTQTDNTTSQTAQLSSQASYSTTTHIPTQFLTCTHLGAGWRAHYKAAFSGWACGRRSELALSILD